MFVIYYLASFPEEYLQCSSILQHVSEFYFFLRLNNIPLYTCTAFVYPFIWINALLSFIWMHVGLFLHLGLMRLTLLKTLIQTSESLLSVLLGKCPEVALGHKVVSFSEKIPYCFPQHLHHFILPPAMHKGSSFSTSSPYLGFSLFYTIVTVMSVK